MSFNFKGIDSAGFGGYSLTDQLLYNIKWFLDHNLLKHGAYATCERDSFSYYSDDESVLFPINDERYEQGRVWNGSGRSWAWESGIVLSSGAVNPFRVSGIYVDGDFHPVGEVGTYAFHVDYLNGRIIFNEPKNEETEIQAEYTRRSVHVDFADSQEFKLLMKNSLEEFLTNTLPSGTPSREHQIWLPSIFIEVNNGKQRGLQLGGGQIKTRYVTLYIFADNPQDRNLLMDWLDFQSRAVFWMADLNSITFPFDSYGDIVPGTTNWVQIVANNPWKKLRIVDSIAESINSLNSQLFRARVRYEIEVDVGNI